MERSANLLGALGVALADRTERVIADSVGLSVVDGGALNAIAQNPGTSISFVSTVLGLTHPGAVRVVDRLANAGLIQRRPGVDGRTVGLHPTTDGRTAWQRQTRARRRLLEQLVDRLDADARKALDQVTEQLLTFLTSSDERGEQICRLCHERSCPQQECPVTLAVAQCR